MPVEYFLRFQGKCYDVGTKIKIKTLFGAEECTIVKINSHDCYVRGENISQSIWKNKANDIIVEVIEPVYYVETIINQPINTRTCPPVWDVEIGWVWYLIVMGVGAIFNARLLIWIVATVVFFSWKNGFSNGGK